MERAYALYEQLDQYLARDGQFQRKMQWAETTLKVNRKSLLLATGGLTTWLLFGLLAPVVVAIIAFIYPALQTLRAIETNQGTAKWLTYWLVYASFTLFESIGRPLKLLEVIPFYFTAKLSVMLWCMAPMELNGSRLLYKMIMKPFFGPLAFNKEPVRLTESVDRRFDDIRSSSSRASSRGSRYQSTVMSDDDY